MEKNKVRSKSGYKVYFLLRISVQMLLFDSIICAESCTLFDTLPNLGQARLVEFDTLGL